MDMNQKLDYSKLTPIELKAIAISYQNMKKDEVWGSDNICIERNKKIWLEKMR